MPSGVPSSDQGLFFERRYIVNVPPRVITDSSRALLKLSSAATLAEHIGEPGLRIDAVQLGARFASASLRRAGV
jgi:hypothetical protein